MRFVKILFPALAVATTLSIAAPAAAECFVNWSWMPQSDCADNGERGTMVPSGRDLMEEAGIFGDGDDASDMMDYSAPSEPTSPTSPPTTPETPSEMV